MSIDWVWLLMGACAVFALGWLASRFDIKQLKMENHRNPKAYFQGLNFLLNEQQDQAIDSFIEAVQQDPDTSELHFALGNLFRRRGEFERAVRVHQHLLARADLSAKDRHRAKFALAEDYLRAGIIDRAEDALKGLDGTALEPQALLALLNLYERSRDWERATEIAKRLEALGEGDFSARLAHYWCEQASKCTEPMSAKGLIEKALSCAPKNARAQLALAQVLHSLGQEEASFNALQTLMSDTPRFTGLGAALFAELAIKLDQTQAALELLALSYQGKPRLDVLEAMVVLRNHQTAVELSQTNHIGTTNDLPQTDPTSRAIHGQALYAAHLERTPSLIAATQWLKSEELSDPQTQARILQTLDKSSMPLKRYRCAACGFEALSHFWQCPGCQAWDSYPPERIEEL